MVFLKPTMSVRKGTEIPQIIAILSTSFIGISSGLSYAWTSPSIPELIADKQRNIFLSEASYLTVISPIAMLISGPLVSLILDPLGRRVAVLLVAVPLMLSWITVFIGQNIWWFYTSRVFDGISSAIYYGTVPVYVCEITQPNVRGSWGNAVSISTYLGIFLMNVIGSFNDIQTTSVICCSFPVLHILFFWFMPESPYYLLMKGEDDKARKSLQILRWTNEVEEELKSLKSDVQRQLSEKGSIKELFAIKSNRRALLICVFVRIAQHLAGIPAFGTYTQYIFLKVGSDISEKTSSIVFTGILFLGTSASVFVINFFGRKPVIIFSCLGSGIALGVITTYSFVEHFTALNTSYVDWLPLVGTSMYIVTFSPGLGVTPTVIVGEMFSSSIKGSAVSAVNVVLATGNLIIPKLFQTLTTNFGIYLPFLLFTCACFISATISYFYVIETKGRTLEDIQQDLKKCTSGH